MRIPRFNQWLVDQLSTCGHPEIASVDWYWVPDQHRPMLNTTNGGQIRLAIVGSSPPGGDDHNQPETIVHRDPSTPIQVLQRDEPQQGKPPTAHPVERVRREQTTLVEAPGPGEPEVTWGNHDDQPTRNHL